jgi:hypothetical protein
MTKLAGIGVRTQTTERGINQLIGTLRGNTALTREVTDGLATRPGETLGQLFELSEEQVAGLNRLGDQRVATILAPVRKALLSGVPLIVEVEPSSRAAARLSCSFSATYTPPGPGNNPPGKIVLQGTLQF